MTYMDDHLYDIILDYAECELLPRFRNEYKSCGVISKCESCDEIKALCEALNAVAPYAGYRNVTPASFVKIP